MNLFIMQMWQDPVRFFSITLVVVFSICCHEYMHARAALFFGDDTAARTGHLTLNPLQQMGVTSLVMLALVGIAWGQVPVNPANYRRRSDEAWVALAGPLTNFVLALLFLFAATALARWHVVPDRMISLVGIGGVYNVMLGIFNLLPVPGLDGGSVVMLLFPKFFRFQTEFAKGAYFTLVILIFVFFKEFWKAAFFISQQLIHFFHLLFNIL